MPGKLTSVRLLLVEDNATDADLVRRSLLRASAVLARFELETVDRASEAAARLATGSYDAVLLDLTLPDGSGLSSLTTVQAAAGDTPVIVVTGSDDETLALAALQQGAQDYLLKGEIDGRSMARSIVYAIERRRALESIRRSEAQLAEAQAIAHLGSFDWHIAADRVAASSELLRIFGVDGGEVMPSSYASFLAHVHPEDREAVDARLRAALVDGKPIELLYRIVRPGGDVRTLQARGRIISDEAGRPVRLTATCQDVTERKKLEDQVLLAGRMTAVGTLSGGVAHEINNPLAYVLSNIDFVHGEVSNFLSEIPVYLRRGPLGADEALDKLLGRLADVKEALDEARHGAERVRNIVRDLKTFSKAEEGKQLRPVVLRQVLESSINLAWNEIRHRARLVQSFGDVPDVFANEARLGQVFVNLLVNAAQAIPEGQRDEHAITVSSRPFSDQMVCVEVRDTGCGIAAENLQRIFDPFFTTKQVGSAMGLGLSICYGIVHAMGGEIQVESSLGKGSVFRVLLPAAQQRVDEATRGIPADAGQKRGRVLVIDDEPMVVATLRRILARQHDVATATSARDALARLHAGQRYDAVLCDLMMPDMTGMALHDQLEKELPDVAQRMIFITGGAFTPRGIEFLDRVPNPRIEKPFDVGSLLALVRGFVR
jgi:PAS domain S-box-containing protein